MSNILIIGATSAIATECAIRWVNPENKLFFVARNPERLAQTVDNFKLRYEIAVDQFAMNAEDVDRYPEMLKRALEAMDSIDIVLIAHGSLPDAALCETNLDQTLRAFDSNATSTISLMSFFAAYFMDRAAGTLAVISSVAGDRGRASNYLYGSAKAAVSTFAEGLAGRLTAFPDVHVVTIKPGLVDTPMTAHLSLSPLLTATPGKVADAIVKAIAKKKAVVYTPFFWRWIMAIIRMIPRSIFVRLKI